MENSNWLSVKDYPLFTVNEYGEQFITEHGSNEFLAAVPFYNIKDKSKTQWWVRHCVVDSQGVLCTVEENDFEPAGWALENVLFFIPIKYPVGFEDEENVSEI